MELRWDTLAALERIARELRRIRRLLQRSPKRLNARVLVIPKCNVILYSNRTPQEGPMALSPVTLDTQHDALIVNAPTDAAGNAVPDSIAYSVSDPSVFSLSPSADTLSCRAVTLKAGTATVSWSDGFGNSESVELTATPVAPSNPTALNATVTIVAK